VAISALLGAAAARDEPYLAPSYTRSPAMPIGEPDTNIFNCPVCSRPLATGVRRCPGCRTRLVMGTPMRRALSFVAVGLLIGAVGGGGILAGATALSGGRTPAPTQPAVIVPPSSSAAAGVTPAPATPAPPTPRLDVPPTARAALGQVGTLNVRLLAAAGDLRSQLDASSLDASAVARTLRSMNSNAAFGLDISKRLATWDAAENLAVDLDAFYEDIRATAREGLAASVRNTAAYEAAATSMLTLLARMEALDADARALALIADVELPRLDLEALGGTTAATDPAAP
jgi:hypothetical protein